MVAQYIKFKNFNKKHQNKTYFFTIKENTFILKVFWSEDCDCAFLSIYDYNDNPIFEGKALVNNLVIRNYNLPYIFYFINENGETYEPTINNIEKEFMLAYEDGE